MTIGNWYRVGTVAVTNGSVNVVGTGTFWTSQCNPGDRFTIDGENWYEVFSIADDTHLSLLSVGGSGAFAGATGTNLSYAIDRNFTNNLNANIAASVAALVAQYQANSNGPLSGLFPDGAAATPGIGFLNEASTGWFHPGAGVAALAVQGAEFWRAVGSVGGAPAMLGLGQTAPANALDLLTSKNALYGARIQNTSTGTAAQAAVTLSNGAQALNAGVNGTGFAASGVLGAARGFVQSAVGIDFASGVTSGTAFSWGVGAGYAQKMALNSAGRLLLGTAADNGTDLLQVNGSVSATAVAAPTVSATTSVTAPTVSATTVSASVLKASGMARVAATGSSTGVPNTLTTAAGWTTTFDANGNFNATTGVFTAPADGYYLVTGGIEFTTVEPAGNNIQAAIVANGVIKATAITTVGGSYPNIGVTVSTLVHVTAGQSIVLQAYQSTTGTAILSGTSGTYFSITQMP